MLPIPKKFAELEARTFGGFAHKKKFTLTVKEAVKVKVNGNEKIINPPIPAGIPDYQLNQKVKFVIGRRGELKALGLNIAFKNGNRNVNNYLNAITTTNTDVQGAGIGKSVRGEPMNAILNYQKTELSGSSVTVYNVSYTLRR